MSTVNPFASSNSTPSLLATDMVRSLDSVIETLIEARIRLGFSESELAEKIGFDEEDVVAFEHRDLSPSLEFVVAYGIAVSVHVSFQASDGVAWARNKRISPADRVIAQWASDSQGNSETRRTAFPFKPARLLVANA